MNPSWGAGPPSPRLSTPSRPCAPPHSFRMKTHCIKLIYWHGIFFADDGGALRRWKTAPARPGPRLNGVKISHEICLVWHRAGASQTPLSGLGASCLKGHDPCPSTRRLYKLPPDPDDVNSSELDGAMFSQLGYSMRARNGKKLQ